MMYKYSRLETSLKRFSDILELDYNLKDELSVKCGSDYIRFIVEHIRYDSHYQYVYFVADSIVGYSTIKSVDDYLDYLEENLPIELVYSMETISHVSVYNDVDIVTSFRKLSLLSAVNLYKPDGFPYKCIGVDDVCFDGLTLSTSRCKSDNIGRLAMYWTCTGNKYDRELAMDRYCIVGKDGKIETDYYGGNSLGVVPCFCLKQTRKD